MSPLLRSALSSRKPEKVTTLLPLARADRKSTRLNSSHTEIYTLSLHDALPISVFVRADVKVDVPAAAQRAVIAEAREGHYFTAFGASRSEEHTSELQSHRDLHSFPTRRSSDLRIRESGRKS